MFFKTNSQKTTSNKNFQKLHLKTVYEQPLYFQKTEVSDDLVQSLDTQILFQLFLKKWESLFSIKNKASDQNSFKFLKPPAGLLHGIIWTCTNTFCSTAVRTNDNAAFSEKEMGWRDVRTKLHTKNHSVKPLP